MIYLLWMQWEEGDVVVGAYHHRANAMKAISGTWEVANGTLPLRNGNYYITTTDFDDNSGVLI